MRRALIVVVAAAALVIAPAAGAWTWPVKGPVLETFVLGDDPYAAGQHRGIDIGAPAGAPVLAPASGTVSFAGSVPVSGRTVTIKTTDGYSVTLTHLGSTSVQRDDTVVEGVAVGTIGPSGEVEHDVPYLHLGIRRSEENVGQFPTEVVHILDARLHAEKDSHMRGVAREQDPTAAVPLDHAFVRWVDRYPG